MADYKNIAPGTALFQTKLDYEVPPDADDPGVEYNCRYVEREADPHGAGDVVEVIATVREPRYRSTDLESALCPGYEVTGGQFNPDTLQSMPEMDARPISAGNLRTGVQLGSRTIKRIKSRKVIRDNSALRAIRGGSTATLAALQPESLQALSPAGISDLVVLLARQAQAPETAGVLGMALDVFSPTDLGMALSRITGSGYEDLVTVGRTQPGFDAVEDVSDAWRSYKVYQMLYGAATGATHEGTAVVGQFDSLAIHAFDALVRFAAAGRDVPNTRDAVRALLDTARAKGIAPRDVALLQLVADQPTFAFAPEERPQVLELFTELSKVRANTGAPSKVDATLAQLRGGSEAAQALARRVDALS